MCIVENHFFYCLGHKFKVTLKSIYTWCVTNNLSWTSFARRQYLRCWRKTGHITMPVTDRKRFWKRTENQILLPLFCEHNRKYTDFFVWAMFKMSSKCFTNELCS